MDERTRIGAFSGALRAEPRNPLPICETLLLLGLVVFAFRSRVALVRWRDCLPGRRRLAFRLWCRFALRRRLTLRFRDCLPLWRSLALFRLRSRLALRRRLTLRFWGSLPLWRSVALFWLRSRLPLWPRFALRPRTCLPRLWLRSRMALLRLRDCLALRRLWSCRALAGLRDRLMLLLSLLDLSICGSQSRWSFHIAIGREWLFNGHIRRAAMIRSGKLGAVGAGSALILELCSHWRSMRLPHGHTLRRPRRNMQTT